MAGAPPPPPEVRADRGPAGYGVRPVRDGTRAANRIRGMPDRYDGGTGILPYSAKEPGLPGTIEPAAGRRRCPAGTVGGYVSFLTEEIKDRGIDLGRAAENRYADLPVCIPGIDASGAPPPPASEMDDIDRFRRPRQMASRTGMCPRVSQSGDLAFVAA